VLQCAQQCPTPREIQLLRLKQVHRDNSIYSTLLFLLGPRNSTVSFSETQIPRLFRDAGF
jgi:hypothetical protein